MTATALQKFRAKLDRPDVVEHLRVGLIGNDFEIETPFGIRKMLYADYVASGRALAQVEHFVMTEVLPYYANSHTEASYVGATMTRMRDEARATIARLTGAGADAHVIFAGAGATAGINRIVRLLDIPSRRDVTVLIGPYEHHSNILPWRESGARVVEIAEAPEGGPDMAVLQAELLAAGGLVVGAFSAASNVTGILTDVVAVTRLLKRHGALAIWDYAGGGPYLSMNMTPAPDAPIDAIVVSAHKFPGGPGASGVLVVRDTVCALSRPTAPGGGTVSFVSPWAHVYSTSVEAREEGGTPNVVGDIRAALVMLVKDAVGADYLHQIDMSLRERALTAWRDHPRLQMLGNIDAPALPIFSFRIRDGQGAWVHQQLFCRMLSDHLGIQARGGCACAGPYAHRLMGIDKAASSEIVNRLQQGHEVEKPGWVRLNLSYLHDEGQVARILAGVADLADRAPDLARQYICDASTARFRPAA
ncbi:aminotransferase class V-fold PLP-dependent enzyme [Falsirhodobacter sp. alg1]|uniref:aminotransferase class V-fold PLP-dependent enzyme n=1 Tax=Falsirhodobacter sp. alg1 TaxID=1472418 RepID=UPI0007898908|nr:aminotransferase class V-fold PLP-dependent enzyme [Falsirhodobacter sp. alg1]